MRSTTLLLSGVAIGAFAGAMTTVLLSMFGERWDLGLKIVHWLMGTFESRGWGHTLAVLPAFVVGCVVALVVRRDLDALHLGDETASSLGVDLRRTRLVTLLAVALLAPSLAFAAGSGSSTPPKTTKTSTDCKAD